VSEYDDATRLDGGEDLGGGQAIRHGMFSEEWSIGKAVNGGLVMATALTALGQHLAADAAETTEHHDPVVFSAYFMTASLPGPFTVATELMRCGRMLSTGQMTIHQTGPDGERVERMRGIGSFGNLTDVDVQRQAEPPDMPPPERCISSDQAPPEFRASTKFLDRFDLRLDPATAGWAVGKPSMQGLMRGWVRLKDGREPDTTMLMMALDALPPVAFDLGMLGWAPTLEFTGHVRRRPEPGWLRVALHSETLGGAMMEEDALIWDAAGNLVAQSRQLCGVRPSR
jgi:acyl-CoA thioesterase